MILRVCTGSLAAAHKGHSRARHFGAIFTFLVQICFACGAQQAVHDLLASLHLGGGRCSNLGASARYARARIELFALPKGTILLGFGCAGAEHSKECGAPCCSHRRCSRRHLQCLPAARVPLYYARLGPVHGLCLAHFCVWLCSVWWLVLIGDCCHLSVCVCPMVKNMAKLSDVPAGLSALETIL